MDGKCIQLEGYKTPFRRSGHNCVIKWALTISNLSRWINFVAKFAYRYPFHTFYMLVKIFYQFIILFRHLMPQNVAECLLSWQILAR